MTMGSHYAMRAPEAIQSTTRDGEPAGSAGPDRSVLSIGRRARGMQGAFQTPDKGAHGRARGTPQQVGLLLAMGVLVAGAPSIEATAAPTAWEAVASPGSGAAIWAAAGQQASDGEASGRAPRGAKAKAGRAEVPPGPPPLSVHHGAVMISEIMYNPASDESKGQSEWVEILNVTEQAIQIEGWRLDDEDLLPFDQWGPFSCTLPPGGIAVIVNGTFVDEAQFRSAWDATDEGPPPQYLVLPVKWGGIANNPGNGNEVLRLLDGDGALVCEVALGNGDDGWPKLTAAGGPSVYLTAPTDTPSDGRMWKASKADLEGARECRPTPLFNGRDIGSPGTVPTALASFRRATGAAAAGATVPASDASQAPQTPASTGGASPPNTPQPKEQSPGR